MMTVKSEVNLKVLSVTETAQRLGVSRNTARDLLNSGKIRTVIVGKRRCVAEEDLAAYVLGTDNEQD